jgi:hypothetical protein
LGNGEIERSDVEANEDESDKSELLFDLICLFINRLNIFINEK